MPHLRRTSTNTAFVDGSPACSVGNVDLVSPQRSTPMKLEEVVTVVVSFSAVGRASRRTEFTTTTKKEMASWQMSCNAKSGKWCWCQSTSVLAKTSIR